MTHKSPWVLLPILLFLAIFIGSGIYFQSQQADMAFYQVSAPVAVLPAIVLGLLLAKGHINERVDTFVRGCGDPTVVTMLLIFLLAGAFASMGKAIGGVEALVHWGLSIVPAQLVLPTLFILTALMATAMGTSMGTIAATAPVAVGLSGATELSLALTVGTVVGGAMFGDNLSVISDTTIASTRTQGCSMKDKFRMNFKIALPAAILTIIWLAFHGATTTTEAASNSSLISVLPYATVLILAIMGLNVLVVLLIGIVLSGLIGLWQIPDYSLLTWSTDIYSGFSGMQEILILSLFIGGLGALMKKGGGLLWLADKIDRLSHRSADPKSHRRVAEISISLSVILANLCTANNTVAILISGSLARDIAGRYGVDPRRSASLMDICSCVTQGIIPYGAQMLLAASMAKLSPLALISSVTYCWLLGAMVIISIIIGWPQNTAQKND
ncbi:Na+/H+ antiporter NhaC family protein [Gynuella sunshinyii]|uniref:Na+/H+ antiporter n=1 Tax=Gynuella sunshinyii YC6258 TaxID=1445510 RepID=A0A0C5VRQ9_9GAMM|nr:Na+/H+ antiporter NhaC family protein [Gynuella sunshinyii]AJQ96063.1 Na+/H+ antiporter [Gynuella sunshinyii YC6258]